MENPADDLPDELVITLRKPLKLGSETYTELRLSEPTADQCTAWDNLTGAAADIVAIATVSGIPEPAVRQLLARDFTEASRYIGRFFS